MLKKMVVLTLLMVALQVRAYEPIANNTFIDEHFIKDSVLVMVSGAVYGTVIETICYRFILLHPDRAFYCKTFAAESLAFINLLRAQQPVWALATCKYLNLLLVMIASGYIGSTQLQPETIRTVLASVFCYQLSRISTNCVAHYLWKSDLSSLNPDLIVYVVLNGFSTGLIIGGPVLWYRPNLEEGFHLMVFILASTGTALLSTVFYMRLIEQVEPEELFSILERVAAGAGLLTIITTRFLLQRLSNAEQPHTISRNLAQAALISVPLLITSWLVSVNEWVMNDVPTHETMQGIYYPVYALFSGEWIKKLYHLIWLTE